MAKPKEYSRYIICVVILVAVFAVYLLQLVNWQIIKGKTFLEKSDSTDLSTVKMDAARGEILDVNGNGLAVNKTGYSIVFDKSYMKDETENNTIIQLTKILAKSGEKWVDELPITVDSKGQYAFVSGKDKEIATMKSRDLLNLNSYATAEQCMMAMIDKYKCSSSYSAADKRTIASVRYNMMKKAFSVSNPYTFAEDISQNTVSIVSEKSQALPGATIKVTTIRQYVNPTIAPHIIGTVGSISLDDYNEFKKEGKTYTDKNISGYTFNDHIGTGGIENALESQLRGKAGLKVVETTANGALASTKVTQPPSSGNSVYLTIDSRIQSVLDVALAKNVQAAHAYGKAHGSSGYMVGQDCVRGGVVVLRVSDFAVLAAATFPSYDPSKTNDASYYESLIKDPAGPLNNNAFNGLFMPGSAFKPMVASAALQEGVINTNTIITCNGKYMYFAPYTPSCMGIHGPINVITALQKSCNVFFFETGRRLGINKIDAYAPHFGLGQKTGIEISESKGKVSGPQERKAAGGTWYGGDVIQTAIGQSDNQFTPLQLATYAATIANNGVRLKTHLVDKVTDYSRKNVILQNKPTTVDNAGISQANFDIVKQGMNAVSKSGSAGAIFGDYDVPLCLKTGTAQNPPHSDNVTLIGFAPMDKPQIAVAVVLEYGATSKYSLTVGKAAFDAYFHNTKVDASGNIVDPKGKIMNYN